MNCQAFFGKKSKMIPKISLPPPAFDGIQIFCCMTSISCIIGSNHTKENSV